MMQTPQPASASTHRAFRAISALMLREMSTTYGRSIMGYLWALAEPVGGVALLTFVFSLALRAPGLGDSFALYYASGFLPFTTFMALQQTTAKAILFSRSLLYYPRVTFVDALVARIVLNSLTQLMIGAIFLVCVIPLSKSHVFVNIPVVVWSYVMAISLAVGVGMLNCYLFWRFPAWERIWSVITRPLFIGSAIFYNFEVVPASVQGYLWLNPLVHVVGQARAGIYVLYEPIYISHAYVFGLSFGLALLGMLLLWGNSKEILNG